MKLHCLYVYLTDACNLKCAHCWQAAPLKSSGELSYLPFDGCRRFLEETIKLGLRSVTLSGGEPMLNPDFTKFIDFFGSNGISCAVETNGMLIEGKRLSAIKRNRTYCAVSLDGTTAETHNKQRQSEEAYSLALRGIETLNREGLKFQIIMSISRMNYHDIEPLAARIAAEWPNCTLFKVNVVWPQGRAEDLKSQGALLSAVDIGAVACDVSAIERKFHLPISLHANPAFFTVSQLRQGICCGGSCGYHNALSVLADGSVSICSMGKLCSDYVLGHAKTMNVEEVWTTSPLLKSIHESTHLRLQGVCANCVFRRGCLGGCRAAALVEYGDFFGPSPSCQALYEKGRFSREWLIDQSSVSEYGPAPRGIVAVTSRS